MDCAGKSLNLNRVAIMGVLNITPDSFSDGGLFLDTDQAVAHGERMAADGADIIDIGGESSRPGADVISTVQELDRVMPVIERLSRLLDCPVSIDTYKPEVMQAAVGAGAGLINDINALQAPGALEMAAKLDVPVCLMHMQGTPETMQKEPSYEHVTTEVKTFFGDRISACTEAGLKQDQLLIDPGFGFGKSVTHNLDLLRNLWQFKDFGLPILAGLSRKSFIGKILGTPVNRRLSASLALALVAVQNGATLLRVHDVAETYDAIRITEAVADSETTASTV